MARRMSAKQRKYFGRARRAARRAPARIRRARRRHPRAALMTDLISAGAYGAVRQRISAALKPVSSMIPAGNIADEVTILAAAYLLRNRVPKMLRPAVKAAMYIEAAQIGQALASGGLGAIGAGNGASTAGNAW